MLPPSRTIPSVTFPPYKSLESSQRPNWSVPSGKSTLGAAYLFTMSIASWVIGRNQESEEAEGNDENRNQPF